MSNSMLNILQVNVSDIGGGAEKIAWDLFQAYKDLGYQSTLAVGTKKSSDPNVLCIPDTEYRSFISRLFISVSFSLEPSLKRIPIIGGFNEKIKLAGEPSRIINRLKGHDDFDYPGNRHILELTESKPDILHCHNLHRDYFDLRALIELSEQIPVVITLHDAWLLSGFCCHSLDCDRWMNGCENCPYFSRHHAISRDAAAYNWLLKAEIYRKSRLFVVTPCQWLMNRVKNSILKPGIVASKVIPNGVDLKIFHPADKIKERVKLGLPTDTKIILFAANGIKKNTAKDYKTLQSALVDIAKAGKKVLCIALGETASPEKIGDVDIKFIPYERDPLKVARYYQVADLYVHPAKADTFPTTILEALACGIPVIGTAVGGIPEQIEEGITGFLTQQGDAKSMAARIVQLLEDDELRHKMGLKAVDTAKERYNLDKQVKNYLMWYENIITNWQNEAKSQNK